MDVKEQILDIKRRLRLSMNGVASAKMRSGGIEYGVNFGVELPRLKSIAHELEKSEELAIALWKESVRECKILAALIYPIELFRSDMASQWIENINFVDLADIASMYLFSRMEGGAALAFRWIASDREMYQYCGYITLAHLFKNRQEMNERYIQEFKDQVAAVQSERGGIVGQAARIAMSSFVGNYGDRDSV